MRKKKDPKPPEQTDNPNSMMDEKLDPDPIVEKPINKFRMNCEDVYFQFKDEIDFEV